MKGQRRPTPARALAIAEMRVISAACELVDRLDASVKNPRLLNLKERVTRMREILKAQNDLQEMTSEIHREAMGE